MPERSQYDHLDLHGILPVFIGRICQEWGDVEHQLAHLLSQIGHIPPENAEIVIATITSNRVHRDIIMNIAKANKMSDASQKKLTALFRRCAKASAKRNTAVHAVYFNRDDDHMIALRRVSQIVSVKDDQIIDKKWLNDTLDQIVVLGKDIYLFTESLGGSGALKPTALR